MNRFILTITTALGAAGPAVAQSLPDGVVGAWDVSNNACAAASASVTRIDIAPERIDTFGGNAILREVERIGDTTFAAGDFQQLEGAAEVEPRTREYFRLDQKNGPVHSDNLDESGASIWMRTRCGFGDEGRA